MKTNVKTEAAMARALYWFIFLTWIGFVAYTGWLFYGTVHHAERTMFHLTIMVVASGVGLLCAFQAPVVAELVTRWLVGDSATGKSRQ